MCLEESLLACSLRQNNGTDILWYVYFITVSPQSGYITRSVSVDADGNPIADDAAQNGCQDEHWANSSKVQKAKRDPMANKDH